MNKQEIQDAKYWIENAESNYDEPCEHIRDVLGKDVYNTILRALDIAEKHMWLPISEAPAFKVGDKFLAVIGGLHVYDTYDIDSGSGCRYVDGNEEVFIEDIIVLVERIAPVIPLNNNDIYMSNDGMFFNEYFKGNEHDANIKDPFRVKMYFALPTPPYE